MAYRVPLMHHLSWKGRCWVWVIESLPNTDARHCKCVQQSASQVATRPGLAGPRSLHAGRTEQGVAPGGRTAVSGIGDGALHAIPQPAVHAWRGACEYTNKLAMYVTVPTHPVPLSVPKCPRRSSDTTSLVTLPAVQS